MNIFYKEGPADYNAYHFYYAPFCELESLKELKNIYQSGFLPYTGDVSEERQLFYMARSLRIDLDHFSDSSENRRINRKVESLEVELSRIKTEEFNFTAVEFQSLSLQYADERIGEAMTKERLDYIVQRPILTDIFTFSIKDKPVGYVLACISDEIMHYWFSFFDLEYLYSHSIGKWMMWRCIKWAKDQKLKYVYLGTCYGKKSLYKVRDHKGTEFFTGKEWCRDMTLLKELCKSDNI